ncbi:glycosyltransferase [Sphingomonas sp. S1-29]|uniref:glycosyltransferase n=1 Tax=Sphingomonas sp. S1-29 TaxID=2991074 RepID=UPI00224044E9|nr:glycosyltransferase [Sphingomonas sp. S1-29]UZK69013.1 glycosyltransferase [Sphingomonas sp. S1-29]
MKPLRIAVVTPRYAISGVPLAQWRLAAALAARGHRVDLIIGRCDPDLRVPDAPGVVVRVLDCGQTRGMFAPLVRYLRRERPDAVFSAEDHLNTFMLLAAIVTRSRVRISGSSRVTPFDTYSNRAFTKKWVLKQLARSVAWRADALTCVSRDMVAQYAEVFGATRHVCVYNIVDQPAARARAIEPVEDRWFADRSVPLVVAAGTLAPWKGFADLIAAAAILRDCGRMVRLVILGEGPSRAALEAQVAAAGLADRVRLPGRVANPLKYFANADVFALSSHVEGLPNVLVEAMLCGCTPVATDCPTGPREVLGGGRFGYLVPVADPQALADGIAAALDRPIAADLLAEAVEPFEESAVIARHFALLKLDAG